MSHDPYRTSALVREPRPRTWRGRLRTWKRKLIVWWYRPADDRWVDFNRVLKRYQRQQKELARREQEHQQRIANGLLHLRDFFERYKL